MGYRVLTLETQAGEEVVIPFATVTGASVSRVPVLTGAQAHVFEVTVPAAVDMAAAVATIQKSALLCHWSSIVRNPEVRLMGQRAFQVTVYPLVTERAPEIEARVRAAIERN
jgi:hypothetical protein